MGENVKELNGKNFGAFTSKGNALVDFWAAWCGPCKMLSPLVEEVAKEMKGKVNFGKVDVEANQDLAEQFGVVSIPTVIFFKDGEQVERFSGFVEKDKLVKKIKSVF